MDPRSKVFVDHLGSKFKHDFFRTKLEHYALPPRDGQWDEHPKAHMKEKEQPKAEMKYNYRQHDHEKEGQHETQAE